MLATLQKPRIDRDKIFYTGNIPDGYQLIQDSRPLQILDIKRDVISEERNGKNIELPVMRVTGVFQRADEKNANGRIYPKAVLEAAVKSIQTAIKERRVMGEFDHPPDAKIHLDRVSHLITKLFVDGKNIIGEAEVMNDDRMPCGAMLSCLLERKVQVGVSSRGVGEMDLTMHEGEEAYEVQDGYALVTFDTVAEPSVSGTQLKVMEESLNRQKKMNYREMRERLLIRELRKYLVS
jgi:hypothetical protein